MGRYPLIIGALPLARITFAINYINIKSMLNILGNKALVNLF